MTERLRDLLEHEAGGLDIPTPDTTAVLTRGRRLRTRRRAGLAGGVAATAAVSVVATIALSGGSRPTTAPDFASSHDTAGVTYAVGTTVHLDGDASSVTIPDKAIKSLFYTSAGVLVRHGDNPNSDGGGPQRFTLISPDGSTHRLGLVTEETVHSTDPSQPYVAYAETVHGELEVVVYDVSTDSEAARVKVGASTQDWFPVGVDGDTVYVTDGYTGHTYAVAWHTGKVTRLPKDEQDVDTMDIRAGRGVLWSRSKLTVVDLASGRTLLSVPSDGTDGGVALSPDGTHLLVGAEVYDVATGQEVGHLPGGSSSSLAGSTSTTYGWTPASTVFGVAVRTPGKVVDKLPATVVQCDANGADCATSKTEIPRNGEVILGGEIRES